LSIESPATVQFLDNLDEGEATALSLAIERHADVLLVDERKATRIARDRGLVTAGTLAVLRDAALSGAINFRDAIDRLTSKTDFHHTKTLIEQVTTDFESALHQRIRDEGEREP
jgi:predicted nucleic acid-binding protein